MLRILIADDHQIVRKGLESIFKAQPDMVVTGEACDGQEVLGENSGSRPNEGHYAYNGLVFNMLKVRGTRKTIVFCLLAFWMTLIGSQERDLDTFF